MDRYELLKFVREREELNRRATTDPDDSRADGANAAQARIARLLRLTRIDLVLLFAIVLLMVVKPD